jgi:tRNA U38,U39,U40 pseudouridine synthase TruA
MKKSLLQFLQIKGMIFKKTYLFASICFFASAIHAQPGRIDSAMIPKPLSHFQPEYTFDTPLDPAAWQNQKHGLNVAFGSTDEAFLRAEVPDLKNETQSLEITGWKGERLNAMILIWSPDTINQVRFIVNDLNDSKGNVLSKNNIRLNMVRYVLSNYPYDASDVSCGEGPVDKAYLMPDRLESFDRFDLPGRTVRPVWLSIDIPSTAAPGIYNGTIEVKSEKGNAILNLRIKVQNQSLPKPHDWSFRLDLWQNPWVIAEYYKVKPWGDEHKALLKKHLKLYADAGGKYITTYAVNSPWADNSYMLEGAMIEWIKRKNGSWKFDYSIFDLYVQLALETGIDKAITIYTPLPWGERFRYINEATGNYVTGQWLPTSDTFKTNWNIFLTDLKTHLEKKGWFNKTYIGVNENAMEQTLSAIRVVKEHSKKWKITYAGDWHPELDSLLDDYSCVYGKEPNTNDINKRYSKGKTSTYYICCTPSKPNTFVFSPPIEGRWLGWYAFAYGYDGLLRWAYDAWVADPVRDARHVYWPAGDAYMVYPGANSSIRFEKMREGIVDFEKLKILKAKATQSNDPGIKRLLQELEQHLQTFTGEHDFNKHKLQNQIQKGKSIVEDLSDTLIIPATKAK